MGTRLILLRHGQIKANRVGRWHGSTDSPLTWRGRKQAKRTARTLRHIDLAGIYSSPLERCQHTARLATRHHNVDIQCVDGLREMSIGEWEDMPFKQLANQHDFFTRATQDTQFAPPQGESLSQVSERAQAAIESIAAQHGDDEQVLVVSHGVALAVVLASLIEGDPKHWTNYHFDNCSLTELEVFPQPVVHRFNQSAHL